MEDQKKVHVFATWQVKEGHIDAVLNVLKVVREESIKENGNLFYTIQQSNTDTNTLILFEGYSNEAAVEEHRSTSHFQDLLLGQIIPLLASREIVLTTPRSEEHTSELQSRENLVCRLLLEKTNNKKKQHLYCYQ